MNFTLPYDHYLALYRYKYLALYHALRTAILEGTLPGGTRLPSTRHLAELYRMSRGSVSQVYDMLLADGYIKTETGRGTFVSGDSFFPAAEADRGSKTAVEAAGAGLGRGTLFKGNKHAGAGTISAEGFARAPSPAGRAAVPAAEGGVSSAAAAELNIEQARTVPLSAWGERLMKRQISTYNDAREGCISFQSAAMPMEHFPYSEWRSALNYAGGKGGGRMESYCPPQGDESLRKAIAAHLGVTRGIRADAGQIVLFSGSMQGIVLLTQLLLEPGSPAVVEEPGFHGIRRAVEISGGHLLPGRVDESGLVPEDWDARLLFVTPSRQFPTGAVLPLDRRRSLLEWARRREAVIIEDDYDSEFRWNGRPIEPLKALDREERVVYIGSFSNSMFSGLRLGYAVLPRALMAPAAAAKALYEPLPGGQLEQRALARFMNTGEYSRHLRRMTRIYGERARFFRNLLSERLGMLFQPHPGDSGLHIYARWLKSAEEFTAFRKAAVCCGTDFRDAGLYWMTPGSPGACFYFAHLGEAELEEGVSRLHSAWHEVQNGT